MVDTIIVLAIFFYVQSRYLPDMNQRSLSHNVLVQCNTLTLFALTCPWIPDHWDFQPWHLVVLPLWGDVWLYFSHRLLHTRFLFQHIHYVHHQFIHPQPIDTFYAHPLENIFQNWCIIGIPLLFTPLYVSKLTLLILCPLFLQNTLQAHNTIHDKQGFHILHHLFHYRNYGAGLHLMDHLFGTAMQASDLPPHSSLWIHE
jgi:sterol desaturase/sphingolipid hydroxylase (fatty acid hydroxylase superfamily)